MYKNLRVRNIRDNESVVLKTECMDAIDESYKYDYLYGFAEGYSFSIPNDEKVVLEWQNDGEDWKVKATFVNGEDR